MTTAAETCRKNAQQWHQEGFIHLLKALQRYRYPHPHLSEYHSKEARLMVAFIEVLLDQLYPRSIWEKCLAELNCPKK